MNRHVHEYDGAGRAVADDFEVVNTGLRKRDGCFDSAGLHRNLVDRAVWVRRMDARLPIALADFPVQPKCSAWREGARKVGKRDLHTANDDRNVAVSPATMP